MVAHQQPTGGCPRLSTLPANDGVPYEYGLATCTKYNTSPPRGIPEGGEEICARPTSNPINCWMDMRACRKAEIARRAFDRSFLGQRDPLGEPHVALVHTDAQGREFYCLQRDGRWVHDGDHDFPVGARPPGTERPAEEAVR